jgi:MFS family permease
VRLYLAMFMMSCAVLVIAPMIPAIQVSHGYAVASLGIIAGVSLLTAVVTELFVGPQADRGHERLLLTLSVVFAVLSLVGSGAADSVLVLTFWRALAGVAFGMFVPAASAIVIRVDPQGVGERLARLQVAEFAGLAAGPFLGALLLSQLGSTHGLEIAGVATIALLPVVLGVRVPRHPADRVAGSESAAERERPSGLAFDLLRHRAVWVALILSVAVTAPVGTYTAMWPRFLADRGASAVVIAASLAIFTLPFLLIAPIAGRFVDRVGPLRGSVWGIWIVAIVVMAYGLIGSVPVIIAVSLIESVGQALAGPGTAAAMARASGAERAGSGQGLSRGVGFLGAGLTAFAAGPVYQYWGARALFGGTALLMIVLVVIGYLMARSWAPELGEPGAVDAPSGEVVVQAAD